MARRARHQAQSPASAEMSVGTEWAANRKEFMRNGLSLTQGYGCYSFMSPVLQVSLVLLAGC